MNKKCVGLYGLVLLCGASYAQQANDSLNVQQLDEVVVSDSRFQLKREHSGKTVIKITAEELERNKGRTVAEVINSKSGIEINGSRSVAGQNLGYFIRGGNNRQVLILIDGIQVNDPSQIANDFDIRLLDLNAIESIEIVKGAASTLYGNSAATAVINIATKAASTERVDLTVTSLIGTNATQDEETPPLANFNNAVSLSGTLDRFTYMASFANQFTNGLSAASGENTEQDAFSRFNADITLGYKFSDALDVKIYGGQTKLRTDIDGFPPPNFQFSDTDDRSTSEQYRFRLAPKFRYKNGSVNLNLGYTAIDRETVSDFPSTFESEGWVADIFNKYVFNENIYTIVGFNYQKNQTLFGDDVEYTNNDPYANLVYVSDVGINLNVGGRLNNHSEYGSQFIYNLNPSYTFDLGKGYGKVFGSYSTSFIAPSLFQLFDPTFGNADLEAEENRTIEAGIEVKMSKSFRFNALFFNRQEENTVLFTLIDPDNFISQYTNALDDATAQGIEFEMMGEVFDGLHFNANYTFTELKEGNRVRLPKHRANGTLRYDITNRTMIGINYQYVGSRLDTDFGIFEDVELDSFSLFDFNFSHRFKNDKVNVFANVTNLFNEDYEEIIGYTTRGRNFSLGLTLHL
ncbi:MAG: TonB-dependent receptor plug domain-containing protein [Croceivirga sp.]